MRRIAVVALIALASCATPQIQISPVFEPGSERTYSLRVDSTITFDLPTDQRVERTELEATSTIEVLSRDGSDARVRLTVRPERFARDGAESIRPEQQVELVVAPDGFIRQVLTVGGLPAELTPDVDDLVPLLGLPLPTEELRLGDHWTRGDENTARQSGVVSAFRVEHGIDAVLLRIGTARPITRERTFGERTIGLSGTEYAQIELAYAFRAGYPIRISSTSEGRFSVTGAGGGTVTIESASELQLT